MSAEMMIAEVMNKFELRVKQGEPTLVRPAEDTQKGQYYLSNLDRRFAYFFKFVYCYKSPDRSFEDAAKVLKESLEKVLVNYYPLAGRFAVTEEGKLVLNCTAEGAVFVEAETDCELEELGNIRDADSSQIAKLAYTISDGANILGTPPYAIQITKFQCGGFTIGLTLNHSMMDGLCATEFMECMCRTAKGLPITVPPFLDRTILRPRNPPTISYPHPEFTCLEDLSSSSLLDHQEPILQRSFVFNKLKLERIKTKAMQDGAIRKCTAFEALSGLVWQARTKALKLHHDQKVKFHIAVNCRKFFDPPLPKGYFGTAMWSAASITTAGELASKPLSFAVGLVQKGLRRLSNDYLRSAIDCIEVKMPAKSLVGTLVISSVAKMSFNDMDFGWGVPLQFSLVYPSQKEYIMLLPHGKQNDSIVAVVALPSSAMKTFTWLLDSEVMTFSGKL